MSIMSCNVSAAESLPWPDNTGYVVTHGATASDAPQISRSLLDDRKPYLAEIHTITD
jgi:hypothetical protein